MNKQRDVSVIIAPVTDMDKFSEEDFLAFLVFAGPPPQEHNTLYRTAMLRDRMDYIGQADAFCLTYFGHRSCSEATDYIGFYGKFVEWYACKQAIAQPDPTLFIESDACIYNWRKKQGRNN